CKGCWNFRRESFHRHSLLNRFRELSGIHQRDAFEYRLLSWSYVVVAPDDEAKVPLFRTPKLLEDGSFIDQEIELRFIGAYFEREPVSYGPDEFEAMTSQQAGESWVEYFKV